MLYKAGKEFLKDQYSSCVYMSRAIANFRGSGRLIKIYEIYLVLAVVFRFSSSHKGEEATAKEF